MRSNKKRIDARIPNWLREALLEMAWKRGYNFTEMLQAAAEKGLMWYQKQWEKMHPNKNASPDPEDDANDGSRSNSQNKYNAWEHDKAYLHYCKLQGTKPTENGHFWWNENMKDPNYLKWCEEKEKEANNPQNFGEYTDELVQKVTKFTPRGRGSR